MRSNQKLTVIWPLTLFCAVLIPARAATFDIADGDIGALKAAITTANTNGQDDVINLAPGGTYSLSAGDNTDATGVNGLPIVAPDSGHSLTINGKGAVITRSSTGGTPLFRLLRLGAGAKATLKALTLSGGSTESKGGAIFSDHATVALTDCTVRDNSVGTADPAHGGGIYNDAGSITLVRCIFSSNKAVADSAGSQNPIARGGAVYNAGGTLVAQLCTFSANSASATGSAGPSYGEGGGIFSASGTLRVEQSTVTQNKASFGAGISNVDGSILLVDTTIDHNLGNSGVGINNYASQASAAVNIANATFSDNSGTDGAAIYNYGSSTGKPTVALQNVTFSGSTSPRLIYNQGPAATIAVRNVILSPPPGTFSFTNLGGKITSYGHNISTDAAGGDGGTGPGGFLNNATDKRNTDPQFDGGLRDNGGPTATIALQSTSPAVNAGDQNSAPTRDQRGFVRAGTADIGAFEFGGLLPVTLANISTRLRVETGDNVLIGGFIITGPGAKRLLIRGIGPSLPIAGKLGDPQLQVYNSAGQIVAQNNNWRSNQEAEIIATNAAPTHDLEAAVVGNYDPGAYTVIVSGADGGVGVGLVEVYDLDRTIPSKLANIATRGRVLSGDNVMIAGFIVLGPDSQKLIVRALGPSLPVSGALANPTLELHDGNGTVLAANDDWRSTQPDEIVATGIPPAHDLDAAIVRTVVPGSYTAIVKGVNNTSGVALVEVYALN